MASARPAAALNRRVRAVKRRASKAEDKRGERAPELSLPDGSPPPPDASPPPEAFAAPAAPGAGLELALPARLPESDAERAAAATEGGLLSRQPPPPQDWRQVTRASAQETVREEVAQTSIFAGALLVSIAASVLPARWRRHLPAQLPWVAGTMISGWAEAFAAAALLVARFQRGTLPGGTGAAVTWVMYLLSPVGLLLLWHLAEGLARAASAMTTGEPLGTSVLWLAARLEGLLTESHHLHQIPAPPPDRVTRDPEGRLINVASATRLPWDHVTTIRFEGQLYMVTNETRAAGQTHRFVYDLAPAPTHRVVRGLVDYIR